MPITRSQEKKLRSKRSYVTRSTQTVSTDDDTIDINDKICTDKKSNASSNTVSSVEIPPENAAHPIQIIINNHQKGTHNPPDPDLPQKGTKRKSRSKQPIYDDSPEYSEESEYDDEDDSEDDDEDIDDDMDEDEEDGPYIQFEIQDQNSLRNILSKWRRDKHFDGLIEQEKELEDKDKVFTPFLNSLSSSDMDYYKNLDENSQKQFAKTQKDLQNTSNSAIPLRFKILSNGMDINTKSAAYKKLMTLSSMSPMNGEYHKLKSWVETLCDVPFGKFSDLPVTKNDEPKKIVKFLDTVKSDFDKNIYGHQQAKDQIIRIIAQWISNPVSKGNVIGIHGKAGVGKTTLIKDGLAKVLKLPFNFIPLGGCSDSSFLDGHSFTYEGSTFGKIVETLVSSKVMNPIIYFDELDKVSDSNKGQEIINVLIHLTDPSQNSQFNDKYFSEMSFDLSRALFVFTYNDDSSVNPILKDRMIRIDTKDYDIKDKIEISRNHMIPEILKQFNIEEDQIVFDDDTIKNLITNTESEAGVRNLKRNIESIVSNINLNVLMGQATFPIIIDSEIIDKYKRKTSDINPSIPNMYV